MHTLATSSRWSFWGCILTVSILQRRRERMMLIEEVVHRWFHGTWCRHRLHI